MADLGTSFISGYQAAATAQNQRNQNELDRKRSIFDSKAVKGMYESLLDIAPEQSTQTEQDPPKEEPNNPLLGSDLMKSQTPLPVPFPGTPQSPIPSAIGGSLMRAPASEQTATTISTPASQQTMVADVKGTIEKATEQTQQTVQTMQEKTGESKNELDIKSKEISDRVENASKMFQYRIGQEATSRREQLRKALEPFALGGVDMPVEVYKKFSDEISELNKLKFNSIENGQKIRAGFAQKEYMMAVSIHGIDSKEAQAAANVIQKMTLAGMQAEAGAITNQAKLDNKTIIAEANRKRADAALSMRFDQIGITNIKQFQTQWEKENKEFQDKETNVKTVEKLISEGNTTVAFRQAGFALAAIFNGHRLSDADIKAVKGDPSAKEALERLYNTWVDGEAFTEKDKEDLLKTAKILGQVAALDKQKAKEKWAALGATRLSTSSKTVTPEDAMKYLETDVNVVRKNQAQKGSTPINIFKTELPSKIPSGENPIQESEKIRARDILSKKFKSTNNPIYDPKNDSNVVGMVKSMRKKGVQ